MSQSLNEFSLVPSVLKSLADLKIKQSYVDLNTACFDGVQVSDQQTQGFISHCYVSTWKARES